MAGDTSGPNEQEVWMAALEHKLDDLLAFVHMIVKRDVEMGNQKRKGGKSTNGEVSEGCPHINMDPLPRPSTPPKPEGKDSQLDKWRRRVARWTKVAARARPPLDEKEMIKIFVDALKNPYFDWVIGLQLQFFVDLIPVGERIEDAMKTKEIVDMPALMTLVEHIAKKTLMEKNEGEIQMIAKNNRKWRTLPYYTHLESAKAGLDSISSQDA
uniref:Uncharacterized protein n=1 Tax=Fagus sylvatica TaxID=28930 RepID=A0A2N9FB87_FAGSY